MTVTLITAGHSLGTHTHTHTHIYIYIYIYYDNDDDDANRLVTTALHTVAIKVPITSLHICTYNGQRNKRFGKMVNDLDSLLNTAEVTK